MSGFVPEDFVVPRELVAGGFRLEPLGPQHNEGDYRAWMSSIEHIRSTPGFQGRSWPREMTLAENLADLEAHAKDFAARSGFTYTVLAEDGGEIVGCVYIYPAADGRDTVGAGEGGTAEVGDGDTAEVGDGDTADVADGDTADVADRDTADVADRDTAEVGDRDTAEVGDRDTAEVGDGDAAGGAEVRSWVRADRGDLDVPLYEAVAAWLREGWPFATIAYAPR
jgi:hypothetical protein